ncbi:2',5'-phosphodiesterase 12-like [Oopsacas minuta]|uniref:2',5'-phosphodiesterase 12-like n=1 Tax=Oopsacas minuta TaxID=111878 RepID=A0AAV7KFX4_9METZ|nr:2',5'-phosphodiesterase 12-like [Oopsacas minuta]
MRVEENSVLYNSLLLWGEEVSYHFLSLGTIFQICILKDKSNPKRVYLVANTHLHSRPSVPYLRLFQMALLITHMERLVEQYKKREGKEACVLLCGDFNSTPDTGLIQFVQTGMIESNNIDWQPWALNVPTKFVFPGIAMSHSLQLFNACGPTPFTHFAGHYTGTLDYIYCDTQHFKIHDVAPMPALWEVSKETALPNTWFPSDHLPIVCTLNIV